MKKNVIVTGGAGFLGSHLVRSLIDKGYAVSVIDDLSNGKKENLHPRAEFFQEDIRDEDRIEAVFKLVGSRGPIDGVFHLAALPRVQFSIDHPKEAFSVNVTGLFNVFEAARKFKVRRIVYSASSSAYGNQEVLPLIEGMIPMPMSPYAVHKHFGELMATNYAMHYGIETVSLRYFNLVGPGADPNGPYAQAGIKFVFLRSQGKPLTIFGDGGQTRDMVDVRDVAIANVLALESEKVGKGETINIGSGKNVPILEVAKMVGGPIEHLAPRKEPRHTRADISLARRLLGWEPKIPFDQTITELKKIYNIW